MELETKFSPLISVIVPIYNMEKLMRKCLDSILAQTFQNYECLLINDGSKDGSSAICDEYAAKDARFKAFHKPNGGLSDARNYGLAHAKGEYTIFFDPDDWVDEDCLKDMYAKAQEANADMVICDYINEDEYSSKYCKQEPTSLKSEDVLRDMITGNLYGFTWNKLLKRDMYSRFDLQYTVGMYGCEDQYTMCRLLKNTIRIAYVPIAFYHYMHYGLDSLSRHYDETTYQHDLRIRELFVEIVKEDENLKKIAWEEKSLYIATRAFKYGQKCFSNKLFKETFDSYKSLIWTSKMSFIVKIPTFLSCYGCYRLWNNLFWNGFQVKQYIKKQLYKNKL